MNDQRLTYGIARPDNSGTDGPFDENELREKLRQYRDAIGEDATRQLAVWEMAEGGTAGRRLDVGQFLD